MSYVKNIWVDQDVERPKTYQVTNNADGSITLTDDFGIVTELGTPVNGVNMNHIEDGIAGCAIRKHNLTETFDLGEWVWGSNGSGNNIFVSKVANNTNNALTDTTKWELKDFGANPDLSNLTATGENHFANKDLSNLTATGQKVIDGQWVNSYSELFSGSWAALGDKTFDLSTYLPDDNYMYDVVVSLSVSSGSTSGNALYLSIYSSALGYDNHAINIAGINTRTSSSMVNYGYGLIPIGTDRKLYGVNAGTAGTVVFSVSGYRRVGTNT